MRPLLFLIVLLPLVGCAKKVAKFTGKSDDSASATQPEPVAPKLKPDVKANAAEKPNWLNDPRFKRDNQLPPETQPKNDPNWVMPANTQQPVPVPAPQGTPQPAPVQSPQRPAKRVEKADMNEVWIFIENASLASGKMPPPEFVLTALIKAKSPAADLVIDGSIVLTGARSREGVWAYELNAPKQGGWVASQNGPENVSAGQFATLARATR